MMNVLRSPAHRAAAMQHLLQADRRLGRVITAVGPCRLTPEPDLWRALGRSIIGQQLSVAAARTIYGRVCGGAEKFPPPEEILARDETELRLAGLSRAKVLALHDLAANFLDGRLQPRRLARLDDEAVIQELVKVRGIGRWTAEMALIFSLGRPDVMAVDDLGLRRALQHLDRRPELPTADGMLRRTACWRPWRSVGSWYLWRSLEAAPKP